MKQYSVLLHASNVRGTGKDGVVRLGGAMSWRVVDATGEEDASAKAVESMIHAEAFKNVIEEYGTEIDDVVFEVEEIREIVPGSGTSSGVITYIGDDAPKVGGDDIG